MIAELWRWLLVATLASSLAVVLVLLLRKPLRQWFGCRAAYWLWALPMVVLGACLLPAPARPFGVAWMTVDAGIIARAGAGVVEARSLFGPAVIGSTLWLLGCVVMAAHLVHAQRCFRHRLGPLLPRGDGTWLAAADPEFGPAVIGVWPSRIVLPQSFGVTWSARQQTQVLAHERCHVQRGDLWMQLLALICLCLFWFNPLVHRAVRLFRLDQELACDATVVGRDPRMVRDYAEALLVTARQGTRAPLCNAWTDPGPLKERMKMLGHVREHRWVHRMGIGAIIVLTLLAGVSAWSMQAGDRNGESGDADGTLHLVNLELQFLQDAAMTGEIRAHKVQLLMRQNEESVVSSDDPDGPWRLSLRLVPPLFNGFRVEMALAQGDRQIAAPAIEVLPDKDASVEILDLFRVALRVSQLTPDNDPRVAGRVDDRR